MKTRWGRQVNDIETWIDIACDSLDDAVWGSVVAEVVDHFYDAYQAARRSGMEPEKAYQAALESLGDPFKSRDGFHQVHLTKQDKRRLNPPRKTQVMFAVALVATWPLWALEADPSMFFPVSASLLFGRELLTGKQPISLMVAYGVLSAGLIIYFGFGEGWFVSSIALVLAAAFAGGCRDDIRLQRKLRQIAQKV